MRRQATQLLALVSISHRNNIDISAQKASIGMLHVLRSNAYKFQILQFNSLRSYLIYFNVFFFYNNREATLSRKEEKACFYAFKLGKKSSWLKTDELKRSWKINS